jgi:hypothetical protein
MKELKDKIVGYLAFAIVFFLHVYFALLLGTRSAWAQESAAPPAPAPAKVEKVETIKSKSVEAVQPAPAKGDEALKAPPRPPKAPKPPKITDTEINIKIDPKEGLSIKGMDKMIEKLEALDRHSRGGDDVGDDGDQDVNIDHNGINIRKHVRIHDDEDEEENGHHGRFDPDFLETRERSKTAIAIIVPAIVFGTLFGLLGLFMFFRYKSRRESLETVRLFIEKGQPIPPELMETLKGGTGKPQAAEWDGYQSHILKGLKPIFWGLGIALFFILASFDVAEWMFGLIFVLIGGYHITKSYLIQKEKEQNPQPVVDPASSTTTTTDVTPKN